MDQNLRKKRLFPILKAIGEEVVDIFNEVEEALAAGDGTNQRTVGREFQRATRDDRPSRALRRRELQRWYNTLAYLKRDGLVLTERRSGRTLARLTARGLRKLAALKERTAAPLPPPRYLPNAATGSRRFIIVAFDIPERDRRKRAWLREALKNLDMRMIQRSVWIGKQKMPHEFLKDLRKLRLIRFVEIFEISKAGTLTHLA